MSRGSYSVLYGNIGKDLEPIKFTKSGKPIITLSLAVGQSIKLDGVYVDGPPMWFKVTFTDWLAESAVDRLSKGDSVVISGRLGQEHWMTKDNNPATTLTIWGTHWEKIERTAKSETVKDSGVPF